MSINSLSKTVKLPYKVTCGSFDLRQMKSEQFTRKIMSEVSSQLNSEGISMSKLGRSLSKFMPENLKVFVKKNKDSESYAQLNRVFSKDNTIVSQSIEIKPDKGKKITNLQIPTITHEVRHLADSLFHPKMLSREQMIEKKGLGVNKIYNLYDNEIYVSEYSGGKKLNSFIMKNIRHKTETALRGFSVKDKIDILQYIRYSLMSERNAFKDEYKTAKKIYKKRQPVFEDTLQDQTKEYMFDEKINLFKTMAFELIKKERGIHKAKLRSRGKGVNVIKDNKKVR